MEIISGTDLFRSKTSLDMRELTMSHDLTLPDRNLDAMKKYSDSLNLNVPSTTLFHLKSCETAEFTLTLFTLNLCLGKPHLIGTWIEQKVKFPTKVLTESGKETCFSGTKSSTFDM